MHLSDVKFLKMRRKDYEQMLISGCDVQNYPDYHVFMQKYCGVGISRIMFDKGCKISGDNRAIFKKHFGKCVFTFPGGHYFHGWLVDLDGTQVIVLTAKDHGTCYEIVTMRDGKKVCFDISKVLEFMDMIAELP